MSIFGTLGRIVGNIEGAIAASRANNRELAQRRQSADLLRKKEMNLANRAMLKLSKDPEMGPLCFGQGAEKNPDAQLAIAKAILETGAEKPALVYFKKAAELGSAEAAEFVAQNEDRIRHKYDI